MEQEEIQYKGSDLNPLCQAEDLNPFGQAMVDSWFPEEEAQSTENKQSEVVQRAPSIGESQEPPSDSAYKSNIRVSGKSDSQEPGTPSGKVSPEKERKEGKLGLKNVPQSHRHTQVTRPDAAKSEGGIMLDAMINNLYAKINDWRDKRKQYKQMEHAKNGMVDSNASAGSKEPLLSQKKFQEVMRRMEASGVDMQKLYASGDMERLLFGRMTNELYTTKPENRIAREGQLFLDEQGQEHCAMKKTVECVVPDLTEQQNEWLKKGGHVVTDTHVIVRNEKSNRIRKVPLALVRLQETYQGHRFTEAERALLFQGEKIRIEAQKDGKKKITFVSFNPGNNQIQHHYPKDLVPQEVAGIKLSEQERNLLGKGKKVRKNNLIDQEGKRYSGTISLDGQGKLQIDSPELKQKQQEETQKPAMNEARTPSEKTDAVPQENHKKNKLNTKVRKV